ncbi:MAG TPA: 4-coumarate--CoA ligase family protein, partial [Porticoccaceae bacterium]|nr:4-coumarate--CoA ligase family protein [Porticoccaceae bacterium]
MIFKSQHADIDIPESDLTSVVLSRVDELGDKAALIDGPTGRSLSYLQLREQVNRLAAGLHRRGFRKGDVFAIFIPNVPEY